MLIAITRKPLSASISRTVITVSYRMELPTFFVESVFVATWNRSQFQPTCQQAQQGQTWARISFIVSLAFSSPLPSRRSSRRILTCRKGSVIPETSCSGL